MIYLDHSATTPVDRLVLEAMLPYWTDDYGNPSSIYALGRRAATALHDARKIAAAALNCQPAEIVFTSCGTEADNLALRGIAFAQAAHGRRHIVTVATEHHAVLHTAADLAHHWDFEVTLLPLGKDGLVDPDSVESAIRPDTALVSVMYANNEVGVIQPIEAIGRIARAHNVPFHTDAVQAGGHLSLDVQALGVDALALSAHKFYGPKGVGLLFVRRGLQLRPMQTGGGQEKGLRSGTENIAYIVGLARALELAQANREAESVRLRTLRDRLAQGLLGEIPDCTITGHASHRLPGHLSVVINDVEAEGLLIGLDLLGVAASSGSACASGSPTPSHVLTAMGYSASEAMGALRLTLGRENTDADVDFVLRSLPALVKRLRAGG
jgi:cysteine desulfurase